MIIKFDHISYVAQRKKRKEILNNINQFLFVEMNLKNLTIKKDLLTILQESHDLYFYADLFPVEYIFYDYVSGNSLVTLQNGVVYGKYSNLNNAYAFLKGIFTKNIKIEGTNIKCNMKGILDKRDYWLVLEPSDSEIQPMLDTEGYGTIAVLTNSLFYTIPIDGICTKHETVYVNKKKLDICFTKSNSVNVIFEIIKIVED